MYAFSYVLLDSITAIAIGVLYLKNMNPGPMIFINNPENIYAIFLVFILANIIMVPLGWLTVKVATKILRVKRNILMPIIFDVLYRWLLLHQQLCMGCHADLVLRRGLLHL
jgi:TctA family transporter